MVNAIFPNCYGVVMIKPKIFSVLLRYSIYVIMTTLNEIRDITNDTNPTIRVLPFPYQTFVDRVNEIADSFYVKQRTINEDTRLRRDHLIEFALSFLRAYQMRNFFDLYNEMSDPIPGLSPSKLRGAFDVQVPLWLLSLVREVLRPQVHADCVYLVETVEVLPHVVGRATDNSVAGLPLRRHVVIGPVNPSHLQLGISIRSSVVLMLQSAFSGCVFTNTPNPECLNFAPLTIRVFEGSIVESDFDRKITPIRTNLDAPPARPNHNDFKQHMQHMDDKVHHFKLKYCRNADGPNVREVAYNPDRFQQFVIQDERMYISDCLDLHSARAQAIELITVEIRLFDGSPDLQLLSTNPVAWLPPHPLLNVVWFEHLYSHHLTLLEGTEHSYEFNSHIFAATLSYDFKEWDFPSLGSAEPPKVSGRIGQGPKPSKRQLKKNRTTKRNNSIQKDKVSVNTANASLDDSKSTKNS
jgi:hypothetical protein